MTTAEEMTTALRDLGIAGTVRNCGTHLEVDTATAEDARRVAVVLDLLPESRREGPVINVAYHHPARTLTVNADVTQMEDILARLTDERRYRGETAAVQAQRLKAAEAWEKYLAEQGVRKLKRRVLGRRQPKPTKPSLPGSLVPLLAELRPLPTRPKPATRGG